MKKQQLTNILGGLAVAITDAQMQAMGKATALSPSECAAVLSLGANPGLSIQSLAGILGLSHSASVRLCAGLAAKGLLDRMTGEDKRVVMLTLTAQGATMRSVLVDARESVLGEAISTLPEPDQVAFGRLISDMLERLTASRAQADHICRLCDETACPSALCPVERKACRLEGSQA
jgi:MarR family transcriptional regulator, negative regulator of the multidrug operon emrRAB